MMKNINHLYLYLWMILSFIIFLLTLNLFNPIIINILLMLYGILICLNLSLWKSNYLLSIMLFLSLISGMFIIFMYFSSMISNEQLKIFINPIFIIIISFLLIFYSMNHIISMMKLKFIYFSSFKELSPLMSFNFNLYNNLIYMYKFPFNYKSILCMIYLFITLLIMMKICSMTSSPLRKIK